MDELDQLLVSSPNELKFFTEGIVVGRIGVHVLCKHCLATPKLTTIELRGSSIGHSGAIALAKALELHPCISHLGLARNGIDTPALAAILHAVRSSPLRFLDLEWSSVDDAGAQLLAAYIKTEECELRTLNLERNDIRLRGATALAEAISNDYNTTLRNLNLGFNRVGNAGAGVFAEALLKSNDTLLTLNLAHNEIGADGGRAIASMLSMNAGLHSLNLHGNTVMSALVEARDEVRLSDALRELSLQSNRIPATVVGENLGHVLQASTKLTALSLADTQAGDSAFAPVLSGASFMTNLAVFDVSKAGMGEACYTLLGDVLSACPALHTLVADSNHLDTAGARAVAGGVRRARSLTSLSLNDCTMRSAGVGALAAAFAERRGLPMRELSVAGNGADTEAALLICTALATEGGLHSLDFARNRISVRIAPHLLALMEKHPNLTSAAIRDNPAADMLRASYITKDALVDFVEGPENHDRAGEPPLGGGSPVERILSLQERMAEADEDEEAANGQRGVARTGSRVGGQLGGHGPLVTSDVARRLAGASPERAPRDSTALATVSSSSASPQSSSIARTRAGGAAVRRPPVHTAGRAADAATAGLAAVEPIPFSQSRVQLHDVESNVAGLHVSDMQLRLLFNEWDESGDGSLSAEEFTRSYLQQLAVVLPSDEKRVKALVDKFARDGRIDFEEFSIMMLKLASV